MDEATLARIEEKLDRLLALMARAQPMIDRYLGPSSIGRWTRRKHDDGAP